MCNAALHSQIQSAILSARSALAKAVLLKMLEKPSAWLVSILAIF
jgi:hypothetical protein